MEGVYLGASKGHKKAISAVRFLEEHVLVSSSLDGTVRIWDCAERSSMPEVMALASRDSITALEVVRTFAEGSVIVTGSQGGTLHVHDLRSRDGKGDKTAAMHSEGITGIALDDAFLMVSADAAGRAEIRDVRSMRATPIVALERFSDMSKSGQLTERVGFSVAKKHVDPVITEDMWDLALGKTSGKRRTPPEAAEKNKMPTPVQPPADVRAHMKRIELVQFVSPGVILTVGNDCNISKFCSSTGQLVSSYKIQTTPISASFFNQSLFIGNREGITIVNGLLHDSVSEEHIENPHAGSVTAVSSCASWGICTGGSDQHVFVHSIQ
jgi:WD40 repeat protein